MEHIEMNRCKVIDNNKLIQQREIKLQFARKLQDRHRGEDPDGMLAVTLLLGGSDSSARDFSHSALRPKADTTVRPNPVLFRSRSVRLLREDPDNHQYHSIPESRLLDATDSANLQHEVNDEKETQQSALQDTATASSSNPCTQSCQEKTISVDGPGITVIDLEQCFIVHSQKYKCPHDRCK
jgi:hypothetical protein